MNKYEKLKEKKTITHSQTQESFKSLQAISNESKRVAEVAKNAHIIIGDIDARFEAATKLTGGDKNFLFTAVALQCIRQYVIGTITQRVDYDESDGLAHEIQQRSWGSADNSEMLQQYRTAGARYRATKEEIMTSFSVPYDVISGTKKYGVGGIGEDGETLGLGGKNHRYKTLGHDPLFGWIFGTANIMTNTLTNNEGLTFHVKENKVDSQGGYTKTVKMFEHVKARTQSEKDILGICVFKQGLHLMSDTYSKEGIALPGLVKADSNLAMQLAEYGMDFGNVVKVGTQAGFSVLINQIIAMIHGIMYDESIDMSWKLYSVRTRKILMYSNVIASMSNVIAVACGAIAGSVTDNAEVTKRSLNYLDIGGLIVTIHRIVSDKKFIYEVKKEFLENEWYDLVISGEI